YRNLCEKMCQGLPEKRLLAESHCDRGHPRCRHQQRHDTTAQCFPTGWVDHDASAAFRQGQANTTMGQKWNLIAVGGRKVEIFHAGKFNTMSWRWRGG